MLIKRKPSFSLLRNMVTHVKACFLLWFYLNFHVCGRARYIKKKFYSLKTNRVWGIKAGKKHVTEGLLLGK